MFKFGLGVNIFFTTALLFVFLASPFNASAGISQPSMIIFGGLSTPEGDDIITGEVEFVFVPLESGVSPSISVNVNQLSDDVCFTARMAIESAPVLYPNSTLSLDKSYTLQVYYGGAGSGSPQYETTITAEPGLVVGPLSITVSEDAPVLTVSSDIDFGFVALNTYLEKTFQISNVGTETLTGTVEMKEGTYFKLTDGGIAVSEVSINLAADSKADVVVRFYPTVLGVDFIDYLEVRTNAGNIDRKVTGSTSLITPTPGVEEKDADFNNDGAVNSEDLLILIVGLDTNETRYDLNEDGTNDYKDLFEFSLSWNIPIN